MPILWLPCSNDHRFSFLTLSLAFLFFFSSLLSNFFLNKGDHLLIAKKTCRDLEMGDMSGPNWPNIQVPFLFLFFISFSFLHFFFLFSLSLSHPLSQLSSQFNLDNRAQKDSLTWMKMVNLLKVSFLFFLFFCDYWGEISCSCILCLLFVLIVDVVFLSEDVMCT